MKTTIQNKADKLKQVATQLKRQYFGIDEVIDQFTEYVMPWYTIGKNQSQASKVGLWGMTGTGKTALVKDWVKGMGLNRQFYYKDCRNVMNSQEIDKEIAQFVRHLVGKPGIIFLDEFQYLSTISESGEIREKQPNSVIWELLDGREIMIKPSSRLHNYNSDLNVLLMLRKLLIQGMQVENNCILQLEKYRAVIKQIQENLSIKFISFGGWKNFEVPEETEDEGMLFLSGKFLESIWDDYYFGTESHPAFVDRILRLKPRSAIAELIKILVDCLQPRSMDVSKLLVIVAGNLDGLYNEVDDYNGRSWMPRLDVPRIAPSMKHLYTELRTKFRPENISRLGRAHIIYPILSDHAFEQIIRTTLCKELTLLNKRTGLHIKIGPDLIFHIHHEAVVPSQGTRPLYSYIHQQIIPALLHLLMKAQQIGWKGQCNLGVAEANLVLACGEDEISYPISDSMKTLQVYRPTESSAIAALHEAGHAICQYVCTGRSSNIGIYVNQDGSIGGQILSVPNDNGIPDCWQTYFDHVTVLLAGGVAEELVFGRKRMTVGSESDISIATFRLAKAFKTLGLGAESVCFGKLPSQYTSEVWDHNHSQDELIRKELMKARERAIEILRPLMSPLKDLGRLLHQHGKMDHLTFAEWAQQQSLPKGQNVFSYSNMLYEKQPNSRMLELHPSKQNVQQNIA